MKTVFKYVLILSILLTQSCALMFNGSQDTIMIRSNEDDVKIYVNEGYVGKNSAVTVINKKGDYIIRVAKKGCEDRTIPITRTFDATTLLGILIDFGVITVLVVDGVATGAWSKAKQTSYVIDPEC